MAGIGTFSRYLLAAAVVAGGMWCALPALAAGDGYAGVMAPSDDDTTSNAPAQTGNAPAPGYTGVTADAPSTDQNQTNDQATVIPHSRESIHDLGTAAIVNDLIENHPPINAPNVDFSATQHDFIAGKPEMEYAIEQQINQALKPVNDQKLPNADRLASAKAAYKNLADLADGLRSKQAIPDDIYKSMGLTDAYINDERNGNAAALARLDAALASLKPYQ